MQISHQSHKASHHTESLRDERTLPLLLADLPDVVEHGLLLLLLPLLLQHLRGHHGLHLVSVVVLALDTVDEC